MAYYKPTMLNFYLFNLTQPNKTFLMNTSPKNWWLYMIQWLILDNSVKVNFCTICVLPDIWLIIVRHNFEQQKFQHNWTIMDFFKFEDHLPFSKTAFANFILSLTGFAEMRDTNRLTDFIRLGHFRDGETCGQYYRKCACMGRPALAKKIFRHRRDTT